MTHLPALRAEVLVEALVPEGALPVPALEVLALLLGEGQPVVLQQPVLLLPGVHPEARGDDEVRGLPALRAGPDDLVLELLGLAPLAQAGQAEAVVAVGQDAEPEFIFSKRFKSGTREAMCLSLVNWVPGLSL